MDLQFTCKNNYRREAVRNSSEWNGIDYLEVNPDNQKELRVYFLHNLPGQPNPIPPLGNVLKKENVIIEGGVRIKNIKVKHLDISDNIVTVEVDQAGDFSWYKFRIINSSTDFTTPSEYDPQLSYIKFSFKVGCPNEFDCKPESVPSTDQIVEPRIDYLAKDYTSFRRTIFDRLSLLVPNWKERNPADGYVMLGELLAYLGDKLSYYQDAVATEAYLGTARKRISVKRHARLLDYSMHDGCNARTWIHFDVESNFNLNKGTKLLTKIAGESTSIASTKLDRILDEQEPLVFETMHDQELYISQNEISFYTWSDTECYLPAGSTSATLVEDILPLNLKAFDVLIFEERYGPLTGLKADANATHRHAVRIKKITDRFEDKITGKFVRNIEWFEEDALPFSLCITGEITNQETGTKEVSFALGNIVLADHGRKLENQELIPDSAPSTGNYRPQLLHTGIAVCSAYNHSSDKTIAASKILIQDPREALPDISLVENGSWSATQDLLASDRFAMEFIAEIEEDGTVQLRFGDGTMGKKPVAEFSPSAIYRLGNGDVGNLGSDTLSHVVGEYDGIIRVRNPLPATGGVDPETIEEVKQYAPKAFRTQERAVTEADYAQKTELHTEVQKAKARFHWTGSWYTVFISVDRKNGLEVDSEFKNEITAHLEKYRMAGFDLEIMGPQFVALDIVVDVCIKSGYFASVVKENLLQIFSKYYLPDGTIGFFHPDNFTFGQPVYLSAIYKTAMNVAGVESVEIKKFQQWAKKPNNEKENGVFQPSEMEIIRLDNDPNFPENGKLEFIMFGGI